MKKVFLSTMCLFVLATLFAGCGNKGNPSASGFDTTAQITVISREASSGTRGAFDELMKIEVKNGDKVSNNLISEAVIVDSTDAVVSKVEVDPNAIGYTSLGAISPNVRAVHVDGVAATVENVQNDSYKIKRPFILALPKNNSNPIAVDFLKYVISSDGQKIVEDTHLIKNSKSETSYTPAKLSGKLTLSGSTSVEKVMEKLREAYIQLNPNVEIEITYSGSGAGIKDVTAGKVNIGMSSRELTNEESASLTPNAFALDAIAVIVNSANTVTDMTSEQITNVFTGASRTWADISK